MWNVFDIPNEHLVVEQPTNHCSEVKPSGIVMACWTTLPSTMVSTTSRTLARLGKGIRRI